MKCSYRALNHAHNLGEQCSICIGFADSLGAPIAGIVFRPIPVPNTYAMGAKSEGFIQSHLDMAEVPNPKGFLTSNGGISPFIAQLIDKLAYTRVPSGGAGNKMLMLLEQKGAAYIQDRGVSRWGTYQTLSIRIFIALDFTSTIHYIYNCRHVRCASRDRG